LYCEAKFLCGSSSVGRAIPCQGIGREFEPLFPLHKKVKPVIQKVTGFFFVCRKPSPISNTS
jgi:hypothetical protein